MSPDGSDQPGPLRRAAEAYERAGRRAFGSWFQVVAQYGRFAAIGLAGASMNMGVLYLLTELAGVHYLVSALAAIESALLLVFFLNNEFTFEEPKRGLRAVAEGILRSNVVRAGGTALHLVVLYGLTTYAGLFYLVANVAAIFVASLFNYVGEKTWNWQETFEPGGGAGPPG